MSTRTLIVEMHIKVRDLTPDEMLACGLDQLEAQEDEDADMLPDPPESEVMVTGAADVADIAASVFGYEEAMQEAFAGSNIYVQIEGATYCKARWEDMPAPVPA